MEKCRVLLLGESYSATHTFVRGRNYVTLPQYGHFGTEIAAMLEKEGFDVTLIVTHDIPEKCPVRSEDFGAYDVVILSDVGSDTMLTQPPNQEGKRNPNRLQELAGYVEQGGGVVMVGGYFSFSGIGNQARYNLTPLAKALPVSISNYDDRVECPEGVFVEVTYSGNTRLFEGIRMEDCPPFGGYNKTVIKEDAELFATFYGDPFLAGRRYGKGRTFAFTTDCAPDWAPRSVLSWEGYPKLLANIIRWSAGVLN